MKNKNEAFLDDVGRFRDAMMTRYLFSEAIYNHMLDILSALARPVTFRRGALLQHQGVPAQSCYWIMSGVARTAFITEGGAEVTLRFAAEGEMAGAHEDVLAAKVGLPARSFVVAEQPVEAYEFNCPELGRLMAEVAAAGADAPIVGRSNTNRRTSSNTWSSWSILASRLAL